MSGPTLFIPGNLEATDWSPPQSELDKHRPIDYIMDRFAASLGREPSSIADLIYVIQSSTGSGKSTALPPETFHRFFKDIRKNICCTQPRVLTSVEIPNTILPYHSKEALSKTGHSGRTPLEMGINIGYQTGVITKKPIKGIIYMTVQVLMQQMNIMSDEDFMRKYSFIYIDEAHERSIGTDFVLYALKKFIHRNRKNKECPRLVVMSATFDTKKFCDYLFSPLAGVEDNDREAIPAPDRYKNIIKVRGTSFPIEEHFLEYDSANYLQAAVDAVIEIHTKNPGDFMKVEGGAEAEEKKKLKLKEDSTKDLAQKQKFRDILIFVGGASEIRKVKKQLNRLNASHKFFQEHPILPLELTSDVVQAQAREYQQIFEDYSKLRVEVVKGGDEDDFDLVSGGCGCGAPGEEVELTAEELEAAGILSNENSSHSFLERSSGILGGREGKGGDHRRPKPKMETKKPVRRVIVATNVAETGITIDSLKYVIDSGWHKSSEFDPTFASELLITKPITQGMYRQRRGRVGRKAPGVCYALYTQKTFNALQVDQYPEIMKSDISLDLLGLIIRNLDKESNTLKKSLHELVKEKELIPKGLWDVFKLDLLDLPSADSLHYAIEKLYTLGALDSNSMPTSLGVAMSKVRFLPIETVKMIFSGYAWNVAIIDLITVAACLEYKFADVVPEEGLPLFQKAQARGLFTLFPPIGEIAKKEERVVTSYGVLKTHLFLADDFLRYLLIFYEWQKEALRISSMEGVLELETNFSGKMRSWCEENGISYSTMLNLIEAREDIINNLALLGFNPYAHFSQSLALVMQGDDLTKIEYLKKLKQCLFEGYKLNLAVWNAGEKAYRARKSHLALQINSPFIQSRGEIGRYGDSNPRYILFDRIFYRQNPLNNTYDAEVTHVSVLDGFCTIDANFDALM